MKKIEMFNKFSLRNSNMKDNFDCINRNTNTTKRLTAISSKFDNRPPYLIPDLYLKPRILAHQVDLYHNELYKNILLLGRINMINRTQGLIDCRASTKETVPFRRNARIKRLQIIAKENKIIYDHLKAVRPINDITKELLQDWERTREDMKKMLKYPYLLSNKTIPDEFNNISSMQKFWMEFKSDCQSLGIIIISLFDKVCPQTCKIFKSLVKGVQSGYAYSGTAVFNIIPDMFCMIGDVSNNNGFGGITLDDKNATPENFKLHHSLPGILSMRVFSDGRVKGIFNLTFKPMPLLDGKSVVFGRVTGGSTNVLNYLGRMGSSRGLPRGKPHINRCGWIDSNKKYQCGAINHLVTMK